MLSTPFIFFDSKNFGFLADTLKKRQNFLEKLVKETKNLYGKNKINKETEILSLLKGKNGEKLQSNVLKWFSELSFEDKQKICAIQDKWLTSVLIQMYLLFEKNNNIQFEPTEEMKIFFSGSNSLNSFKLLINEFSPNDEIKNGNEKEEEEISKNRISKEEEINDLFFYKKYFNVIEKAQNEKDEEKENIMKDLIQSFKIISLGKDNDLDAIIISSDLLSNLEKFKRYFKFFSNDNYFKEWIFPFKHKNNIFNFYMPSWMRNNNLCFSFCQLIIGFIEQHILLNYEYFYLTNNIYKLISKNIIERLVNVVINDKNYSAKITIMREILNKVYLEKFNYLLFDKNLLTKDEFHLPIFKELECFFKNINQDKEKIKLIDVLSFLGFNEVIKSRYYFYFHYKKTIINCLTDKLIEEEKNKNKNLKINQINEIHNYYKTKNEDNNDDDKLVRNISKTTASTNNKNKDLSTCGDDSVSFKSDTNIMIDLNKDNNKNANTPFINNYNINNMNNTPDKMFSMYCNYYYNKAINDYCLITNNNLRALKCLYVEKLELIEKIITDNLKDKFEITFGHYGSFFTGLSIEGSDMDICIYYKAIDNNKFVFYDELYELLKKQKPLLYEITPINSIEMPLFKLKIDITEEIKKIMPLNNFYNYIDYEDLTTIKIDITFDKNKEYLDNCLKNVEYIKNEINNYPQIKPVLLYLKRYFKKMDMNKVFLGGINSFSLFLLILNVIKSEQKQNPNNYIGIGQLLYLVLRKFSFFNFANTGIGADSYDYNLKFVNDKRNLYILSPINGKNVASIRCKTEKISKTFLNGYNILSFQINYFLRNAFNNGLYPCNQISSIICLFNSKINWF